MVRILQQMDPDSFEYFLGELYGLDGEWKTRVTQTSNDQGIDIVLEDQETSVAVQAKRYGPNTTVSRPEVQQYAGLKQQFDFDKVYVVTTNEFTSGARKAAQQASVRLVNGNDLCRLIQQKNAESLLNKYGNQSANAEASGKSEKPGGDVSHHQQHDHQHDQKQERHEASAHNLYPAILLGLGIFGIGIWQRLNVSGGSNEGGFAVLVGYALLSVSLYFDEGYARLQQTNQMIYEDEIPHVASILIALWLPVTLFLGFSGLGTQPNGVLSAFFYYLPAYPLVISSLYLISRQRVIWDI
jgi:hypothetical protein